MNARFWCRAPGGAWVPCTRARWNLCRWVDALEYVAIEDAGEAAAALARRGGGVNQDAGYQRPRPAWWTRKKNSRD
jgi:hypothetical protein